MGHASKLAAGLVVAFALLLSACGTAAVSSTVTRFHAPNLPRQASFVILPEEGQKNSLEFKTYAEMVAAQLVRQGFRPAAGGPADLVVNLNYGTGDARTEMWTVPTYASSEWWWRHHIAPPNAPRPGPYYEPVGTDIRTTTVYTRWVAVDIHRPGGAKDKVFEGRAVSEGSSRELVRVMPYLVTALFKDFPGTSGVPVEITVSDEEIRR